jgi:hypothetical protein
VSGADAAVGENKEGRLPPAGRTYGLRVGCGSVGTSCTRDVVMRHPHGRERERDSSLQKSHAHPAQLPQRSELKKAGAFIHF